MWGTDNSEQGYVLELKSLLRDAPKSGLSISTQNRMTAWVVSSTHVSFEYNEAQMAKARGFWVG